MSPSDSDEARKDGPSAGIQLDWGQASDPGKDPTKQVNEDSCGYAQTSRGHLFVVCDGMGGHSGGKQASEIAIRTIYEQIGQAPPEQSPREALRAAIEEAGRRVYALGGPTTHLHRPGATCVALLLHDGRIDTAHVGDSRAYTVRGKRINRLTRDHSMVQQLIDAGSLSEQEAAHHPDANKITRALGMTPEVQVELRSEAMELYGGDVYVLATDGLTDLVMPEEILQHVLDDLDAGPARGACDALVALANERGGHDNITVQIVHVRSVGPKRSRTLPQEPSELAEPSDPGDGASGEEPPAADTVPDDTAPTVVRSPEDDKPTKLYEPPSRVATTAPEPPAPTIVGAPAEHVATTVPDRPQPTVVDPALAGAPAEPPGAVAARPSQPRALRPPAGDTEDEPALSERPHPLLYVVVVMAVIIGLLMIALLWLALGT